MGTFGYWLLYCHIMSYFCLFLGNFYVLCQAGTLDWMVVMAINSWWLASVILSSASLLPPSVIVCFLSYQIKGFFFLDFSVFVCYVTDTYSMCLCGWLPCMCSSQKEVEQEELDPGRAMHYTWAEPTGSRELCWKCGSYSGKLKSEEVPYPSQNNVCCCGLIFINSLFFSLDTLISHLLKTESASDRVSLQ